MENKITDEDIILSLKIISTTQNCNECRIRNCPWGKCNCAKITAEAALCLIDRIEQTKSITSIRTAIVENAKKNALKEYVERLKENIAKENNLYTQCAKNLLSKEYQNGYEERNDSIVLLIDSLLKEMAGDQ